MDEKEDQNIQASHVESIDRYRRHNTWVVFTTQKFHSGMRPTKRYVTINTRITKQHECVARTLYRYIPSNEQRAMWQPYFPEFEVLASDAVS